MKVLITSEGNTKDSLIDKRFGRCAYFAIYDTADQKLVFEKNENKDAPEGAGPASVSFAANNGVVKIISGEFGFKIKGMLTELGIQMIMIHENKTVDEIIKLLPKE